MPLFSIPDKNEPTFAIYHKEGYSYYEGYEDIGKQIKSDYVALCLSYDDVDECYNHLKAKGAEFIGEPRDIPKWYYRCVLLRDPEGNSIDLGGPLKENN